MGLGGLSGVGIDLITSTAHHFFLMGVRQIRHARGIGEKRWVYANKECTLNTAVISFSHSVESSTVLFIRQFTLALACPICTMQTLSFIVIKGKRKGTPLWGTHRLEVLKHYRLLL